MIRRSLRALARQLPPIGRLLAHRDTLTAELNATMRERDDLRGERDALLTERSRLLHDHRFVPPGHFYSPIPSPDEVAAHAARRFTAGDPLPGIDLNEARQHELLHRFLPLYREMPFRPEAQPGLRYRFENGAYSYGDAITLYAMIRTLRPRRVVEIGSGHSSCVILDTNDRFFGGAIETVFVEPYPELLHSLLLPGDEDRITIHPQCVQDVDRAIFAGLDDGDILLIDSTHVAKTGSDVNHLLFTVLPALRPGVRVHVHDIFYPFDYPADWVEAGRAWNEAYALRAFLQFNRRFAIEFWTHHMALTEPTLLEREMPLFLRNPGASLWMTAT